VEVGRLPSGQDAQLKREAGGERAEDQKADIMNTVRLAVALFLPQEVVNAERSLR